jgi:pimeloyl-ACP methyl ester carboxylesterase
MPRYARNGNVSLAYEVFGKGDRDILVTLGWVGSFQTAWEHPAHARWLHRLGTLGRVIMWDKRGTGLSERLPPDRLPTLEERMDDMRVVMDAVGSERAVPVGISEGASLSAVFAASHPERVDSLILVGGFARTVIGDDYPWGVEPERTEAFRRRMGETWGDNAGLLKLWAPSVADDPVAQDHWNRMLVFGGTPATAIAWLEMTEDTDVRAILPAINVPTLVVHRVDDRIVPVEHGKYLAEQIPNAQFVELPRADHLWWVDGDDILEEIGRFLTGTATAYEPDRVLATVLFTDIVDSTTKAAELRDAVRSVGLEVRSGLHTGEVELNGDDISGIAVNIGARVGARADAGEVLVSQTVKDLVAGSGLAFDDRGEHDLKGVPGPWRLWSLA